MDKKIFEKDSILNYLKIGESFMRIITDEKNNPADVEILWINNAFEEISGLSEKQICGKRLYEAFPYLKDTDIDWVSVIGKVGLNGKDETVNYKNADGRWFLINLHRPKEGYVVSEFNEITGIKVAEESIRITEEKFAVIFENAPYACILTDSDGKFVNVNRAFTKIFETDREAASGKSFKELGINVNGEVKKNILESLEKQNYAHEFEFEYICGSGEHKHITANLDFIDIGQSKFYLMTAADITGRKVSEAELKRKEQEYRELTDSIGDIFFALDKDLRFTYWNKASEVFSGIKQEDAIGKTVEEIFGSNDDVLRVVREYRKALDTKNPVFFINEYYTGKKSFFEISVYPSLNGLSVFSRDITARKESENSLLVYQEQLRKLNERITNIRENERTNISREIHDDLGQALSTLKMDLNYLKKHIDDPSQSGYMINLMDEIIGRLVERVREISSELRPLILDGLGLGAAIDWYAGDFSKKTGIETNTDVNEDIFLSPEITITFYRIFQEAMTNVLRHSCASIVNISLFYRQNLLVMTIEDNGKGIPEEMINSYNSLGLLGMRERADSINGNLEIISSSGIGTKIKLEIEMLKG